MRKIEWKKWLIAISSGSFMMQVPGCTETATVATSVFTGITAGGVLYLVSQILRD